MENKFERGICTLVIFFLIFILFIRSVSGAVLFVEPAETYINSTQDITATCMMDKEKEATRCEIQLFKPNGISITSSECSTIFKSNEFNQISESGYVISCTVKDYSINEKVSVTLPVKEQPIEGLGGSKVNITIDSIKKSTGLSNIILLILSILFVLVIVIILALLSSKKRR